MKKITLLLFYTVSFLTAHSQNFTWTQHGGSIYEEQARAVCTTAAGDVLILCVHIPVGCTDSIDFDGGPGTFNLRGCDRYYIAKYSSSGQFLWAKSGTGVLTSDTYTSFAMNHYKIYSSPLSGDIYITGNTSIFKYDSLGNFIWQRFYGNATTKVWDMDFDSQDNIYSTGIFSGTGDFNPGAGVFNLASAGGANVYILKLDSAGTFIWATRKDFLSAMSVATEIFSDTIIYYTVASTFNQLRLLKIDSLGSEHWNKPVVNNGVYSYTVSIATDSEANSYLTCILQPDYAKIIKCDTAGNVVWNKFIPVAFELDVEVKKACVHGQELYIAGDFSTTIDFDPSPAYDTVTARNNDIFIAKYDTSGNFLGKGISGSGANERLYDMTINAAGNIYICGTFQDSLDEDLSPAYDNIYLVGGPSAHPDFFVSKVPSTLFTHVNDISVGESSLLLFPNPAHNSFTISLKEPGIWNRELEIFDVTGRVVYKQNLSTKSLILNTHFAPGIYLVRG